MGRGTILTIYERGQIDALPNQDCGMREIARKLGRSLCAIQNYVKNKENYGKRKYIGRPKVLSSREIRAIARLASNSVKSVTSITME